MADRFLNATQESGEALLSHLRCFWCSLLSVSIGQSSFYPVSVVKIPVCNKGG